MLTLLGSLLGFGTSFLPKVMDYFQDRQDKSHELDLMDKQLAQQIELGELALRRTHVEADTKEFKAVHRHDTQTQKMASQWTATYSATVRPTITYFLAGMFVFIKVVAVIVVCLEAYTVYQVTEEATSGVQALIAGGDRFIDMQGQIWDDPTAALFATIISFWFGGREIRKREGRL